MAVKFYTLFNYRVAGKAFLKLFNKKYLFYLKNKYRRCCSLKNNKKSKIAKNKNTDNM